MLHTLAEGRRRCSCAATSKATSRPGTGDWAKRSSPNCARSPGRVDGRIRWQFIDVTAIGDDKTIGETEQALYEQGLRFTRIAHRENGVTAFQNIWPCAIVTVRGVDYPVQFLRSENMDPDEVMVQNAINQVEFNLGQAIRLGLRDRRPVVGMLQGHGCWAPVETADFTTTLVRIGDVVDVRLDGAVDALCERIEGRPNRQPKYDALMVAGPDSTFSDKDKLLLDQYLMNGVNMLWLIDPLATDLDSIRETVTRRWPPPGRRACSTAVPPRCPAQPQHGPRRPMRAHHDECRADGQPPEHADVQLVLRPRGARRTRCAPHLCQPRPAPLRFRQHASTRSTPRKDRTSQVLLESSPRVGGVQRARPGGQRRGQPAAGTLRHGQDRKATRSPCSSKAISTASMPCD